MSMMKTILIAVAASLAVTAINNYVRLPLISPAKPADSQT